MLDLTPGGFRQRGVRRACSTPRLRAPPTTSSRARPHPTVAAPRRSADGGLTPSAFIGWRWPRARLTASYPGLSASAGPASCAFRPRWNSPLPPHQGQVTSCGLPPRPEISLPVPRQGVQVLLVSSGVAPIASTIPAQMPGRRFADAHAPSSARRMSSIGACRPVNSSKLWAPWRTSSSRPPTTRTRRMRAARTSGVSASP